MPREADCNKVSMMKYSAFCFGFCLTWHLYNNIGPIQFYSSVFKSIQVYSRNTSIYEAHSPPKTSPSSDTQATRDQCMTSCVAETFTPEDSEERESRREHWWKSILFLSLLSLAVLCLGTGMGVRLGRPRCTCHGLSWRSSTLWTLRRARPGLLVLCNGNGSNGARQWR